MHDSSRYPVGIMHDKPTTNFAFTMGLSWLSSSLVFTIGLPDFLYIAALVGYF